MRYHSDAIRELLSNQAASGQSVAAFCTDHNLVVATFYSWRRKYATSSTPSSEGFCKIVARPETATKKLRLPSGLELELTGMTTSELIDLILAIDRAHA
ncbi:MAG: transposase [Bacteroidota bacterium]